MQGTETAGTSGPLGKSGAITFAGGTLQYSSTNAFDYSSRFATTSQPMQIDTNGQTVTFASALMGSTAGSLTLNDTASTPGSLSLTAANAYSGTTTITGGTLQVGNGGTTGSLYSPSVSSGNLTFGSSARSPTTPRSSITFPRARSTSTRASAAREH